MIQSKCKCDNCGKEADLSEYNNKPFGWISITVDIALTPYRWDFCDPHCVIEFVDNNPAFNTKSVAATAIVKDKRITGAIIAASVEQQKGKL
jgi:hypothetical protein